MCYVYSNDRMYYVYLTEVHVGQSPRSIPPRQVRRASSSLSYLILLLTVVTVENDKGSNDFLYLISDGMSVQCRDYGLGDHPSRK